MNQQIAAIVVTFNRKHCLGKCLQTLLEQDYPLDGIFIIDNASSDGTQQFLLAEGFLAQPVSSDKEPVEAVKPLRSSLYSYRIINIHYVRMHKNIGGAGGFYEGIQRGFTAGFDWLWLMDDDGFPATNTLKQFVSLEKTPTSCYCPIVVDASDKDRLAFGFAAYWSGERITFETVSDVECFVLKQNTRLLEGYGNFFNGIFISNEIVSKVGFPRKEMIIWGDENEYLFRILSMNFKVQIILDAHFFHPGSKLKTFKFLGKDFSYSDQAATWKYYYLVRNNIYISAKYQDEIGIKWPRLKAVASDLILAIKISRLRQAILIALFDQIMGIPYRTIENLRLRFS